MASSPKIGLTSVIVLVPANTNAGAECLGIELASRLLVHGVGASTFLCRIRRPNTHLAALWDAFGRKPMPSLRQPEIQRVLGEVRHSSKRKDTLATKAATLS